MSERGIGVRKPKDLDFAWFVKHVDGDFVYIASNIAHIDRHTAKYLGNYLIKIADYMEFTEKRSKKHGKTK